MVGYILYQLEQCRSRTVKMPRKLQNHGVFSAVPGFYLTTACLGVFPTIFANNAKGSHTYNRVLAALYRPITIPRKRFSAGWATPFLPSGEIFFETKLWHCKGTLERPNDIYKNVLMSLSDLCSNGNIFPIFHAVQKYRQLEKENMLLVGFELTANQIALHIYTRQTRGLQSISETPAGYLPLISVCGL
jgi:hypothetical protein